MSLGDDFTGFKYLMHRAMMRNEVGKNIDDAYEMKLCTAGRSGYSFGPMQWDLTTQNAWDILKRILDANNYDSTLITTIKNAVYGALTDVKKDAFNNKLVTVPGQPSQVTIKQAVNLALQSTAGRNKIAEIYSSELDNAQTKIESIAFRPENDPRVNSYFTSDDDYRITLGKLFLFDYDNQLRITPNLAMDQYLRGQQVNVSGYTNPATIQIVGDSFGIDDILNFYFSIQYATRDNDGKGIPQIDDLCRRFSNLVDITYQEYGCTPGFIPVDDEEAFGLMRLYREHLSVYLDPNYQNNPDIPSWQKLLTIDDIKNINAFVTTVILPTKQYVIEHNSDVAQSGVQIDGDVVVGECNESVMRSTRVQSANDLLRGTILNDLIYGFDGTDGLIGGIGQDFIYGGNGWDVIDAGPGNDRIEGGKGDDILFGGTGIDEYHYHSGDGMDAIIDSDRQAVIYYDGIKIDAVITQLVVSQFTGSVVLTANNGLFTLRYDTDTDTLSIGRNDDKFVPGDGIVIYNFCRSGSVDEIQCEIDGAKKSDQNLIDMLMNVITLSSNAHAATLQPTTIEQLTASLAGFGITVEQPTQDQITPQLRYGTDASDHIVGSESSEVVYGFGDADVIEGYGGADYIYGGAGGDVVYGDDGNDELYGEDGNDFLFGDSEDSIVSNDYLNGGAGQDVLAGGQNIDYVFGGDGDDLIIGGTGKDILNGEAGNDLILGEGVYVSLVFNQFSMSVGNDANGNIKYDVEGIAHLGSEGGTSADGDIISGGDGVDIIYSGMGDDIVSGDADDDFISGGAGNDVIYGGSGNDFIYGYSDIYSNLTDGDKDRIFGGSGQDTIYGGIDGDYINGGDDNDVLYGGDGDDVVTGMLGDDVIHGDAGNDELYGGDGNDILIGGTGGDLLDGGTGADELQGNEGDDLLYGDAGNDALFGGDGDDTLFGDQGDDQLVGGADVDNLYGGDGNDKLWGQYGADLLSGDAGADELVGGDDNDTLIGGEDDDKLWGEQGDDSLDGNAGNDYLDGGIGNDVINGGAGSDELWGGDGQDTLDGGEGVDYIEGGEGNDTAYGSDGDDAVYAGGGNDLAFGDAGNDTVWGEDGDDLLFGGDNNDTLSGGIGNDALSGDAGNDLLYGEDGDDTLSGGSNDDLLIAGTGNDLLAGDSGTDTLYGQDGNDTLIGGSGDDILYGGIGSDTYIFSLGDGHDVITESAETDPLVVPLNILRFADGIDSADVQYARTGSNLVISHTNGTDSVTIKGWFASSVYRLNQVEFSNGVIVSADTITSIASRNLVGTDGNDTLYGTSGADVFWGGGGNDTIYGNGGNDSFTGGPGNDIIASYNGNSVYQFNVGDGLDTITDYSQYGDYDWFGFGPGISPDDITYERSGGDLLVRHINGNDGVVITGWYTNINYRIEQFTFADYPESPISAATITYIASNVANNYSYSLGDGAKTISDWGGNDAVTFGVGVTTGNLTVTRNANDLVIAVSGTSDSLVISGWFTSNDRQIESFIFADGSKWASSELTSKFLHITGSDSNDVLYGGDYTGELIEGYAGNDTLYGYSGDDTLSGGTGNDTLNGGAGLDTYLINAGDGVDVINDGQDNSFVTFGAGLSYSNRVLTQSGNNLVITFNGTTDQVTLNNYYSDPSRWILVHTQEGTARADTLTGTAGWDIIYGNDGSDTITGGDGWDRAYGGLGDDSINAEVAFGDGGSDTITGSQLAHGGEGNDTIYSATNYYTTAQLYGDAGNDVLIGSAAGTDYLYGGDGDDILGGDANSEDAMGHAQSNIYTGGTGNDLLRGTSGNDLYNFSAGDGADTIIENTWDSGYNYYWSSKDVIRFDSSVDSSQFTATRDGLNLIIKYTPTDTITVQNWFSSVVYQIDTIQFINGGTTLTRDDLTLLALTQYGTSGNDSLLGAYNFGDKLYGLAGDDNLYGYSGNDILDGGAGNDQLFGGAGDDTYQFNLGNGADIVIDTEGYNTVQFGDGIVIADIVYGRSVNDLVISINGTNDSLVVKDFITNSASRQISFVLSSGEILPSASLIAEQLTNVTGTSQEDLLTGSTGYDRIYGYEGADTLIGLGGSDELYGGQGNDSYVAGPRGDIAYVSDDGGFDTLTYNSETLTDLITSPYTPITVTWTSDGYVLNIDGFKIKDGLAAIEQVQTSDGTYSMQQVLADSAAVNGYIFHNNSSYGIASINGTEFNDRISVFSVDEVSGNGGNDWITGDGTGMKLNGGAGDDILEGGLNYSFGNDVLYGGAGNDLLCGGGSAKSNLADGDDTYIFYQGDGKDAIIDNGGMDNIVMLDVARADVSISLVKSGKTKELLIVNKLSGDSITVKNWGVTTSQIESITFSDGVTLTSAELNAIDASKSGGTLRGTNGNDRLVGSALNETILAKDGDDTLDAGAGNDILDGGNGNDDYLFSLGWGQDTIIEKDGATYNDMAAFGTGITSRDLEFAQSGNDLIVSRIGSTDTILIKDWYLGSAYHVEEFRLSNGTTLLDTEVNTLIQAMATFQQEHGGISWEQAIQNYQTETNTILAASW